jgi:hypothetical protein
MCRMTRSQFLLSAAALPGLETALAQNRRVFELRIYTTLPGRLPALLARFRDHTTKLFEKHGMVNVGYWVPRDPPASENKLYYMLAHPSSEAAKKSWDAFRTDPDWIQARTESEKDGKIVDKTESVYLDPTDFSQMK